LTIDDGEISDFSRQAPQLFNASIAILEILNQSSMTRSQDRQFSFRSCID